MVAGGTSSFGTLSLLLRSITVGFNRCVFVKILVGQGRTQRDSWSKPWAGERQAQSRQKEIAQPAVTSEF